MFCQELNICLRFNEVPKSMTSFLVNAKSNVDSLFFSFTVNLMRQPPYLRSQNALYFYKSRGVGTVIREFQDIYGNV